MTALAILDLGYGNTDSIRFACQRIGVEAALVSDGTSVEAAERLILPGVGAAKYAMRRLVDCGLVETLRRRTTPMLGICLGMQLMFERSDEGDTACLGLIRGCVRTLSAAPGRPVPHMGWTRIDEAAEGIGLAGNDYVYFAHGFTCDDGPATSARATYGAPFPAAIRQRHLWGAQFHPERSSDAGARFLAAFLSS